MKSNTTTLVFSRGEVYDILIKKAAKKLGFDKKPYIGNATIFTEWGKLIEVEVELQEK